MQSRSPLVAALLAIALVACSEASRGPAVSDPPASGGTIVHPTHPAQLVLRVASEGGFVAPSSTLSAIPPVSLYRDGTIITPGPQVAIYPGPALPAIQQRHLSEEGVQAIVHAALEASLDHGRDMTEQGTVGIADAATTVLMLDASGVRHTTRVYALGETGGRPPGMSQQEFLARAGLQTLVSKLERLDAWLPSGSITEATAYEATSARLFVSDYRGDPSLPQRAVPWPLAQPLGSSRRATWPGGYGCLDVAGADWADTVMPAAGSTNQLTPWLSGGRRWSIVFRPLLPDEGGC
jgi:hypothetical protein